MKKKKETKMKNGVSLMPVRQTQISDSLSTVCYSLKSEITCLINAPVLLLNILFLEYTAFHIELHLRLLEKKKKVYGEILVDVNE